MQKVKKPTVLELVHLTRWPTRTCIL